ncbi:MAG: hypothetical protein PHD21_04140 [Flavobacteriales bacterium]|nr:hypothetical protein [Flavobacteriales bacterium]
MFFIALAVVAKAQHNDSISVNVIQKEVFVLKDDNGQQLNFDFSLKNNTTENVTLNSVDLYVYDANNNIRNRPVTPNIATIPHVMDCKFFIIIIYL